jgi:hypothetical protein
VEPNTLQATHTQRCEGVVMLLTSDLPLDGGAAVVEVAEIVAVPRDVRVVTRAARRVRLADPLVVDADRNDRMHTARLTLTVDALMVVSLVHRARLRGVAAGLERVEERSREQGLAVSRALYRPRERQAGLHADSGVELVPVEAAAVASADRGAVAPTRVGVAVPLPLRTVFPEGALAVGERCEVGFVDCDLLADARDRVLQGGGDVVETVGQLLGVEPQLDGEAVAGPEARVAAKGGLEREAGRLPAYEVIERVNEILGYDIFEAALMIEGYAEIGSEMLSISESTLPAQTEMLPTE